MEYVSRLFNEAWERHHGRQRRIAWAGALACLGALAVVYMAARGGQRPPLSNPARQPPGTVIVSPSAMLSRPSAMGIRCRPALANACDIGLAIWLKRPARSVRATVDGREFTMTRVSHRLVIYGRSTNEYDGFFLPAEVGKRPVASYSSVSSAPTRANVWLLIDVGRGHAVITHSHLTLMSGWG